ncbi:MAG TPA: hypothetical protein PLO43_00575 [Chlamydiales bacterium]|nr:hypothetical protein [Chlamydiales bacterium]
MLINLITFPMRFVSYRAIHALGHFLGPILYYLIPKFRKRALSNIALALKLPNSEIRQLAKASFANLAITCLEYLKLARETDMSNLVTCINPETAQKIIDSGKGIIFFCAHQANWEILFMEAGNRMPGIAIGRPIKNARLYKWLISIRERFGGRIVEPKNAIKESLRALRAGKFVGIVGDQGMPESSYAFPFFGVRAWTTPTPAILAHRTGCPIIVATCVRLPVGRYEIHYSDPIWPEADQPLDQEIKRMMTQALGLLEESIAQNPDQWLWQHNRWKQETPSNVYYRFRKDPILIIIDNEDQLRHLQTFREIYPRVLLTLLAPKHLISKIHLSDTEIIPYRNPKETLLADYRFKLVYDLTNSSSISKHYGRLSAFEVLNIPILQKLANQPTHDLSELLKKAVCRAP